MKPEGGTGLRFSQVQRNLDWVSPKVLTQRLRELEDENIVNRKVDATSIPAKVSYSLTGKGEALRKILVMMQEWGIQYGGEATQSCIGQGDGFSSCENCRALSLD